MKLRHFFTLGICFLTFGFSQQIYAQDMGVVDEAAVEETEAVESGEEKSDEAVKKQNIFVRVANVFMNLPFGYDLGCEPTLHGSLTYFNLKYKWSEEKHIFSRLLFNYGTTLDINHNSFKDLPSSYVQKYEKEDKAVDFKLIPWGKSVYFQKEKQSYFTIEPGLNFRMEFENVQATIKAEGAIPEYNIKRALMLFDIDEKENRYIIRPYYSTSLFMPVAKPISVTFDILYAPLYFYWSKANVGLDLNYYKNMHDTNNPPEDFDKHIRDTVNSSGMAENYIDTNVIFSLFNAFAVSGRFMYERKHTDEYNLNSNLKIETDSKNKYDMLSLKFGGSLINIGKADMRIKTGVFYQWDWKYDHNRDKWEKEGKWIFGVGMRNLY